MIKNLVYTLSAQCISLILGILKVLILPLILGIQNFGYWQVYLLYVGYLGIFSLGFNDGIMLRFGKYEQSQLPKPIFRRSIQLFFLSQVLLAVILAMIFAFESNLNKEISFMFVALNLPMVGLTGVLLYILQTTNQLKKYSVLSIIDKLVVTVAILIMWFLKVDNFVVAIIIDTMSRAIALMVMVYYCRDLLFGKRDTIACGLKELKKNISSGIKVMISNLLGMLVLGYGLLLTERFMSIENYSAYAFSISTTNLVLFFAIAIGTVIYPLISRKNLGQIKEMFPQVSELTTLITLILLIVYFPLKILISNSLPEYISVFNYLPFIFLFITSQAKMQILINPYYKRMRKEKNMLQANLIVFLFAIVFVSLSFILFKSILLMVISTYLSMYLRVYLSEKFLENQLLVEKKNSRTLEIVYHLIFLSTAYQTSLFIGFIIYLVFIIGLIIYKRKLIRLITSQFFKQ